MKLDNLLKLDVKNLDKKYWAPLIGAPILLIISITLLLLQFPSTTVIAFMAVGSIVTIAPYFAVGFFEFQEIKKAEDAYPNFLRDLTQAVNSGMTFPQAWRNFTNLLKKSELVTRINGIIMESFEAGGDIGAILISLSEDIDTIKKMEADKRSTMLQHLGVMYVVFFVFLGIIVTLHQILLPILFL